MSSLLPIMITGANGFLGLHVTKGLLRRGLPVYAAGRNKATFPPDPNSRFIKFNLQHDLPLDFCGTERFSSVIHLASYVPSFVSSKGLEEQDAILEGVYLSTLRLLKALVGKTEHFMYASSIAIYGNAQGVIDESSPCQAADYYGMYKYFGEELCRLFTKQFGIRLTILRFTQLYGPKEPHGIFLQRIFLENARKGEPIPLVRGGRDERDLLWIEDAADAVLAAVENQVEGTFNIASGTGTTIKSIAELLCKEMKSTSELLINDDGSPAVSQIYSIERARKELGFNPIVSIEDGLSRLCQ